MRLTSLVVVFFFFFKQKTAYEMLRSLVGSEMCIRDSACRRRSDLPIRRTQPRPRGPGTGGEPPDRDRSRFCLLYTSDAADDLLCVDLGGRRIIKKKKAKD